MSAPRLIECDAEVRHPKAYMYWSDSTSYPPPCMYCAYASLSEAHAGCEHSHHRRYRRSKWYRKLGGKAYTLGLSSGGCWTMDAHCHGCYTIKWRGKRVYVLGLTKNRWRCILRGHHWPGEPIGLGACAKCVPWICCGSKRYAHKPGCPESVVSVASPRSTTPAVDLGRAS